MAETKTDAAKEPAKESKAIPQEKPNLIVEVGDKHNRLITIDTFTLRLRGHWSGPKLMAETGRSLGDKLSGMPDIPGINIQIFMQSKEVAICDPLNDPKFKDQLDTINAQGRKARQRDSRSPWKGIPDVRKKVDDDVMKTLLMEIHMHLGKPEPTMTVKSGQLPTIDQIKKLSGRQLYDPWANTPYKPKYVDEFNEWAQAQRSNEAILANLGS